MPVQDCKKQWKALRDKYRREKDKSNARVRSGAGSQSYNEWEFMNLLRFLYPFAEAKK